MQKRIKQPKDDPEQNTLNYGEQKTWRFEREVGD